MNKKRRFSSDYPIDFKSLPNPSMLNFQFIKKNSTEIKVLNQQLREQQLLINKMTLELFDLKNYIEEIRKQPACETTNTYEPQLYSPSMPELSDLQDIARYSPTNNFD